MRTPLLIILATLYCSNAAMAQNLDSINRVTVEYCQQGQYDKALVHAFKAETLIASIAGKNNSAYLIAVFNIGSVYYFQRLYEKGEPYFERAYNLILSQQSPNPDDWLMIMAAFTDCAIKTRHYSKAYLPLLQFITVLQGTELAREPFYFSKEVQFGMVLYETKKADSANIFLEDAIGYFQKSLKKYSDSTDLELAYRYAGIIQYSKSQFEKARMYFSRGLALSRLLYSDQPENYLYFLKYLGLTYSYEENYPESIKFLEEASTISKRANQENTKNYIEIISPLADAYRVQNQYAKAIELYRKVVAYQKTDKNTSAEDRAFTLHALGFCQINVNDSKSAEPNLKESIDISLQQLHTDSLQLADQFYNLSRAYIKNEKKTEAIQLIEKLLPIYERVHQKQSTAYFLLERDLAVGYAQTGRQQQSDSLYTDLIKIAQTLYQPSSKEIAELYRDKGYNLMNIDRYQYAIESLGSSAAIFKQRSQQAEYAAVARNLGICYLMTGNINKAEPLIRDALQFFEQSGDPSEEYLNALEAMGLYYDAKLDFQSSLPYYRKCYSLGIQLYDTDYVKMANPFLNLYTVLQNLGYQKEADSLLQSATGERLMSLDDNTKTTSVIKNTLAWSFMDQQKYTAAIMLFSNAIEIQQKNELDSSIEMATSLFGRAVAYFRSGDESLSFVDLKKSISIIWPLMGQQNNLYINASLLLSRLLAKNGQFAAAELGSLTATQKLLQMLRLNFESQNNREKLYWYQRIQESFNLVPAILELDPAPTKKYSIAAFNQQIVNKGFILNDDIKTIESLRKNGDENIQRLLNKWQADKNLYAEALSVEVKDRKYSTDSLANSIDQTEKRIAALSAEFRKSWAGKNTGFAELQSRLDENEVAIEFVRFRDFKTDSFKYAAFVVTKKDSMPQFVPICEELALQQLLSPVESGSYAANLYRGAKEGAKPVGFKGDSLYQLIWSPLEKFTNGKKIISFAPIGLLNRVSFVALSDKKGSYLIDQSELREYTSIINRVMDSAASKKSSLSSALLIGGINYDRSVSLKEADSNASVSIPIPTYAQGSPWKNLPGTLAEISNIESQMSAAGISINRLSGDSASKQNLISASQKAPSVLHIATHGFFQKDELNRSDGRISDSKLADPMLRCGLVLAGANLSGNYMNPYAILTAYEISQLDLSRTDLVVISACETALGDIEGAEGVFGFQRAFKMAGVSKMIVSLWQVPDKETSELMAEFYRGYLSGLDARKAFLLAQQSLRNKYSPYYWAAFVFIE